MSSPFNAWREGLPFYAPPLAIGAVLLLPLWPAPMWFVGACVLAFGLSVAAFFRDPERTITAAENELVSPADGTVRAVEFLESCRYCDGPSLRISIFLSIFNVHVNRAPFDCTVKRIEYQPGLFMNAMKEESTVQNEANTIYLETPRGPMVVRQITGAIARRIVCHVAENDKMKKGERIGMIRFGSRTDLYLPPGAVPCVKIGDTVQGGAAVVARFE